MPTNVFATMLLLVAKPRAEAAADYSCPLKQHQQVKTRLFGAAVVALSFFAASFAATAAEMPIKGSKYSAKATDAYAAAQSYFDWNGFYIGANVGAGRTKSSTDALYTGTTPPQTFETNADLGNKGSGSVGGQVGANMQHGMFVVGLEGDFQYAIDSHSTANIHCPGSPVPTACNQGGPLINGINTTLNQKVNWFSTVRPRVGISPAGNSFLVYATGGVALASISTNGSITGVSPLAFQGPFTSSFSSTTTKAGWTLGGGVEFRLLGKWTGKVEYLHLDYGSVTTDGTLPQTCSIGCGTNLFPVAAKFTSHVTDDVLRVGINHKF